MEPAESAAKRSAMILATSVSMTHNTKAENGSSGFFSQKW
jgi:hypothetical protein